MLGYAKHFAMLCAGTPITWASENGSWHCGKAIYIFNINTRREISCLSDNGGQRSSFSRSS